MIFFIHWGTTLRPARRTSCVFGASSTSIRSTYRNDIYKQRGNIKWLYLAYPSCVSIWVNDCCIWSCNQLFRYIMAITSCLRKVLCMKKRNLQIITVLFWIRKTHNTINEHFKFILFYFIKFQKFWHPLTTIDAQSISVNRSIHDV